jgi:hypothetical protein
MATENVVLEHSFFMSFIQQSRHRQSTLKNNELFEYTKSLLRLEESKYSKKRAILEKALSIISE